MGRVNRRIGKSSETANTTPDGTGGGVIDGFLQTYFNRSGNVYNYPGAPATGVVATGGTRTTYEDGGTKYAVHTFTSSGSLVVSALSTNPDYSNDFHYLVIGGGGGGGSDDVGSGAPQGRGSGGGGAGGYRASTPEGPGGPSPTAESILSLAVATYPVTIGAGGAGSIAPDGSPHGGSNGSASVFAHTTAKVCQGGGGGHGNGEGGTPGGSGGGGARYNGAPNTIGGTGNRGDGTNQPTPTTVPNQGYPGGGGASTPASNSGRGGGGGGAGAAGNSAQPGSNWNPGGTGGIGKDSSITGSPVKRGGGGNAGGRDPNTPAPSTGVGYGGGEGAAPDGSPQYGSNATANTGGGGGGGGGGVSSGRQDGGNGGSGVVIVRYVIGPTQS